MSKCAHHAWYNPQQVYVPALVPDHIAKRAFYRHLFIACQQTPHQICGKARHVGFTSVPKYRGLPMYRLMIYEGCNAKVQRTLLPELFVLEQEVFRTYVQWFSMKDFEDIECSPQRKEAV